MTESILVTGGAGYIGSHVAKKLHDKNFSVVVVDDLSNGSKETLKYGEFIEGDVGSQKVLDHIFNNFQIKGILHFAGSIIVPESMEKPDLYYKNNTLASLNLIQAAYKHKVRNFIFSSSASVYGNGSPAPMKEDHPTDPQNPYAWSKLMTEKMLQDITKISGMNHVILRYFNVAGADSSGELGQRGNQATHLIKICAQAATEKRSSVHIYGDDYDTPDGTGVRDYIHVEDLANAHVLALEYLLNGGESEVFNCGYGKGFSVKEIVSKVKDLSKKPFEIILDERRKGDVSSLIADSSKIKEKLGWDPSCDNLELILKSAIEWESKLT